MRLMLRHVFNGVKTIIEYIFKGFIILIWFIGYLIYIIFSAVREATHSVKDIIDAIIEEDDMRERFIMVAFSLGFLAVLLIIFAVAAVVIYASICSL